MARKQQRSSFDDGQVNITAFCPGCWFKLKAQFFPTVTEWAVRGFFKRMHATLPSGEPNSCSLAPKVPHYDGPRTAAP
jgi:hypothetical protein